MEEMMENPPIRVKVLCSVLEVFRTPVMIKIGSMFF
jgi:hypothetical protein